MITLLDILALLLCLWCILAMPKQGKSESTEQKEKSHNSTLNNTATPSLASGTSSPMTQQQLGQTYVDLYHKLHNLEKFPDVLPLAYETLVSLLYEGLLIQRGQQGKRSILDLEKYDRTTLEAFIFEYQEEVYEQWEECNQRQASGQPLGLFQDQEAAREWLKQIAPLRYVDGAWLGYVHKISTPFALREVTKNAWQVLSEELGDGELDRNHVHLYRTLLESIGLRLPASHSAEFIDQKNGIHNVEIWKSATAQLLISMFLNEFLPEMLGFNLHYELITLERGSRCGDMTSTRDSN